MMSEDKNTLATVEGQPYSPTSGWVKSSEQRPKAFEDALGIAEAKQVREEDMV